MMITGKETTHTYPMTFTQYKDYCKSHIITACHEIKCISKINTKSPIFYCVFIWLFILLSIKSKVYLINQKLIFERLNYYLTQL